MEIVTHIVAADDDEYQAVGDSINPLDEWSGIEAPRLDTIKIATLHSLLTGDPLQVALDLYEPVYVAENETVVLRIADELMENWQLSMKMSLRTLPSRLLQPKSSKPSSGIPKTFRNN